MDYHKKSAGYKTLCNPVLLALGKNEPDMNCQPPKISSTFKNFYAKFRKTVFADNTPINHLVKSGKKYNNHVLLTN